MLDTISKYVYEVYRCKSVSVAAKNLFISQPALSSAIKKAEAQLGAPIFDRKTLPFSLTAEGKVYMEAIERMLQIEKQTVDRIHDIRAFKGGTLRIGTSTHISFYVIPKILEIFRQNHPHVDINILMTESGSLFELLEKGAADLIFSPIAIPPEGYTAVPLFEETFVVAIPSHTPGCGHLHKYAITYEELVNGTYEKEKRITDLSMFHGIEFIYSPPNTNIHKKRKILFGKSDIPPYITSNASRQQLNYNLMLSGFGALLTTDANIATMPSSAKCMYFVLGGGDAKQCFSIVYPEKESDYTAQLIRQFVATAKELFSFAPPSQLFQR